MLPPIFSTSSYPAGVNKMDARLTLVTVAGTVCREVFESVTRKLFIEAISGSGAVWGETPQPVRDFEVESLETANEKDVRVQAVLALLDESINSKPSVTELAEAVNLSPSHLRRLFKAETGIPLNRYLKQLRLQKAKELIETTFLNMKQIMFAVGVKDKSQFARDFKKLTGLTPTEYAARFRSITKFSTEKFRTNNFSYK